MIISKTKNTKINEAIWLANDLLNNKGFYEEILAFGEFDMSDAKTEKIIELMKVAHKESIMQVHSYFKKWSRAYGYYEPNRPTRININTAKLNRSIGSLVASIIHEYVHYVDGLTPLSFGHGSNSPNGKSRTSPYAIDNIAQSIIEGEYIDNNESSLIINTYTPWYKRLFRWLFWTVQEHSGCVRLSAHGFGITFINLWGHFYE